MAAKPEGGVWGRARGSERQQVARYITAHRPKPAGLHINYNSWWTSPAPYTEKDILGLMKTFEEKLAKPYGVPVRQFCIDMGWSDPKTFWGIKKTLPAGVQADSDGHRATAADTWGCGSRRAAFTRRRRWIRTGPRPRLETFTIPWASNTRSRLFCLGGERSQPAFEKALVGITSDSQLRHIKFDGIWLNCDEKDHGHQPGALSSEAMAEGIISVFEKVRQASPEIWLEPTCFGYNASPWWLFYVNSVTGAFGDDAPCGRVPCPVYRESYTTARDFFNLQGTHWIKPIPVQAQEVLGSHPVARGADERRGDDGAARPHVPAGLRQSQVHGRRPLEGRGGFLQVVAQERAAAQETEPILPATWAMGDVPRFTHAAPMPREPYGYAHFGGPEGLVALRNPWIEPANYKLKLDGALGVPAGAKGLTVVSLYPEARVYGKNVSFGDTLRVPLAPYETVVLSLAKGLKYRGLPGALDVVGKGVVVEK